MLFATVVPIAYFLLYLKNKQVTFVFLKFVMAFVICLYWATYACTFFYSYYDVIGWFKILIIPVFSIYSGFVLHLLKSKKKKVFFRLYRYCPWMRGMATSQISCNNGIDKKASHVPL